MVVALECRKILMRNLSIYSFPIKTHEQFFLQPQVKMLIIVRPCQHSIHNWRVYWKKVIFLFKIWFLLNVEIHKEKTPKQLIH